MDVPPIQPPARVASAVLMGRNGRELLKVDASEGAKDFSFTVDEDVFVTCVSVRGPNDELLVRIDLNKDVRRGDIVNASVSDVGFCRASQVVEL